MGAKIFRPAQARLGEVWDYTFRKWGEEQADDYVRDLVRGIEALPDSRYKWRRVKDAELADVWFMRIQHHYIFFRELPSGAIGVISILHENMDLPARLKEDFSHVEGEGS